jgi:hypothetical protein
VQRREQHDPYVLRVAGLEHALCLPLHDQVVHQPERRGGGRDEPVRALAALAGEHQFQQRGVLGGEPQVSRRHGVQARPELRSRGGERRAQVRVQPGEPDLGQRVQQRLTVREVPARRGVAYADLAGQFAQRELVYAVLAQAALGGGEQCRAQISVVVSAHGLIVAEDVVVDIIVFGDYIVAYDNIHDYADPRLTGRTVVVTGANSGIGGAAAARAFAGTIDFDELNWKHRPYRALPGYAQSRLANLLFTAELQRRLAAAGSPVLATAAHPGMAATNLLGHLDNERSPLHRLRTTVINRLAQSDDGGAMPTLYAAVADIPGGSYVRPGGFLQGRGAPKLVSRSKTAQDSALARRLWTVSEELAGVAFPLTATKAVAGTPR